MPINIIRPAGLREEDLEKIEGMEEHGNEWHLLDLIDGDMLDVYKKTEYPELLRSRVKEMIRNNYPELEDEDTLLESLTALIYKIHVLDAGEFQAFVREDMNITILYEPGTYTGSITVDTVNTDFRVEIFDGLNEIVIEQATGVTASASYDDGTNTITVTLDDTTSYTDSDIQSYISDIEEVSVSHVVGQDTATASGEWIGTVTMTEIDRNIENVNAKFFIKIDEKLDREEITDVNGEINTDLLDNVIYVYELNHDNFIPLDGEFTVEENYTENIIYANVNDLGTLLEEQAEMDFEFELEFEDMRELGDITILDVNGNPVVGAEVYMEHSTNPDLFTGSYTTDDNGEYSFLALRNEPMKYEIIYDGVHSKGEFMHEEPYEYTLTFINSEEEREEENQLSVLLDGIEFTN